VCGPHTHIIRDYKRTNPRVNAGLVLLLYVCGSHTWTEPGEMEPRRDLLDKEMELKK